MQFLQRHFSEELQLSHTSCGSPLFVVLLNQPLINLKSAKTSILVYIFLHKKKKFIEQKTIYSTVV
jgi:hypothetical protein